MPVELDELRTQLTLVGNSTYDAAMKATIEVINLLGIRAILSGQSMMALSGATEAHNSVVVSGLSGLLAYTAAQRASAQEARAAATASHAVMSQRLQEALSATVAAEQARATALALQRLAAVELDAAMAATTNRRALVDEAMANAAAADAALANAEAQVAEARATRAAAEAAQRAAAASATEAVAAEAQAAANNTAARSAFVLSAASTGLAAILVFEAAMFAIAAVEAAALAYAYKTSIEAASEFEEAMGEVRIKLSATNDEMERLESMAQSNAMSNLGKSAIDVAQGYATMADDVRNAAEMQQMAIPIARLSVAANMEMAQSSELMITVLRQWNLTAEDSASVADQLVGAWTKTGLKADELASVYEKMGNVAAKLGWHIAEVGIVADELADQLGGPEQVGQKLAMVMQKIASPTDAVSEAFAKAGLNMDEAMQHAGSAAEMIAWLQTGVWTLSDATDAFGRRAATAFLALLNVDPGRLEEAARAAEKAGEAERIASEKMAEWKNQVKQLKAALTDLAVSGGESVMSLSKTWLTALTAVINGMKLLITQGHDVTRGQQEDSQAQQQAVVNAANAIIDVMIAAGDAAIRFTYAFVSNLSSIAAFTAIMQDLALAIVGVATAMNIINPLAYIYNPVFGGRLIDILKGMTSELYESQRQTWATANRLALMMPENADAQVEKFKAMMDKVKESIPNVVEEMFKPGETGGNTSLNAPDKPVTLQSNQLDQIQKNVDALDEYLQKLKEAWEIADAAALDDVTKSQLKQAYNERRISALVEEKRQVLALIAAYDAIPADVMRGKSEAEQEELQNQREEAMNRLTSQQKSLDQQIHEAQVEQIRAHTDLQKKLLELNEKEREKSADHMDQMARKSKELNDHLNKSVQMVLGGSLSKLVTDEIDRLTGAGLNKDRQFLRGVQLQGNNRITLDLEYHGEMTDGMKDQVSGFLVGAIRQANQKQPFGQ